MKTDALPAGDEEPEGQSEQLAAPASEKVPALQGWQDVTPSPKKPASHRQAALPAVEVECGGHAAQLVEPDSLANLPAGQSVHSAAAEVFAYLPTAQSEHEVLPGAHVPAR